MKFLIETDDDTFWRVDQLLRWLYVIDNSGSHNQSHLLNKAIYFSYQHKLYAAILTFNPFHPCTTLSLP